jgi:hypothetical protein
MYSLWGCNTSVQHPQKTGFPYTNGTHGLQHRNADLLGWMWTHVIQLYVCYWNNRQTNRLTNITFNDMINTH